MDLSEETEILRSVPRKVSVSSCLYVVMILLLGLLVMISILILGLQISMDIQIQNIGRHQDTSLYFQPSAHVFRCVSTSRFHKITDGRTHRHLAQFEIPQQLLKERLCMTIYAGKITLYARKFHFWVNSQKNA